VTEQAQRFEYHGSGCEHPACRRETAELAVAHFKARERYERKKAKTDFDPLAVRFAW